MASLTKTARTILRSRLRRHNDALLIAQHIESAYGAKNISDLTTAALIETARTYDVTAIPGDEECRHFDHEKAQGRSTTDALEMADRAWCSERGVVAPKWALPNINRPASLVNALGPDTPDSEPDDADDQTESEAKTDPVIEQINAEAKAEYDEARGLDPEIEAKAAAEAKAIMGKMGAGDFAGYQAALLDVARRAHKPAEVRTVTVAAVDPSKIKGHVPKKIGEKHMRQAGLPASLSGVLVEKTTLPVYDTPDAPALDKNYQWPAFTPLVLSTFRRGQTVFGHGPAGTGKTELAKQIAAAWGRRFIRISCDDQTEAATLVGMTVPAKDGGTVWQDGQLTAAIRVPGAVILIDEPSVARPGALFVLQALLDSDRRLHIAETGEVIPVAPDVVFMLADNTNGTGDVTGQYEATRRLNRATLDRAAISVAFDYLSPAEESNVIASKSGLNKRAAAMLAKFAAITRAKAGSGEVSHGIGLRRLLAMGELLADGADPSIAFQVAVIESAPYDDKEPLRQMWTGSVDVNALAAAAGHSQKAAA